jgi:NADH dehydrogenase FAD-containing subunit
MSKNVVIIGGGFGGIAAARALKNEDVEVTLIDKTNHHLFLPLIYQVATSVLSPSDVAAPIREVLRKQKNARVVMGAVDKIDMAARHVRAGGLEYDYDYLVVASGVRSSYFGKDAWEPFAPGLKTLADAIDIREKILTSLEKVECECPADGDSKLLTFVVVGGGPTGVEIAGAVAEITRNMLKDFRRVKPAKTRVILLETAGYILCEFRPSLRAVGKKALERLGIEVRVDVNITAIDKEGVHTSEGLIETENIIWAAGARSQAFAQSMGTPTDKSGRILVNACCSVEGHPGVFVIGDAAVFMNSGSPLPTIAPVAIQQGKYVSGVIAGEIAGKARKPFVYKDKGTIAILGTYKALLQRGRLEISGYPAWLVWMFLHIAVITEFRNRYMVLAQWLWYYATRRHGVRLITGGGSKRS